MDRFIIAFSHYYFHSQRAVGHVKSNACLLARLRCFAGSKERFVYLFILIVNVSLLFL